MTDTLSRNTMPYRILPLLLAMIFIFPLLAKGNELTLIYSNDIWGEIEPCG